MSTLQHSISSTVSTASTQAHIELSQEVLPLYPKKAHVAPLARESITPAISLSWFSNTSLTLEILVSPDDFAKIVKKFRVDIERSKDPSSAALLGAVAEFAPQACKVPERAWRLLRRLVSPDQASRPGILSAAEYPLVRAALSFLSSSRGIIAGTPLRVMVLDQQHPSLVGVSKEAECLARTRHALSESIRKGPLAQYAKNWNEALQQAQLKMAVYEEMFARLQRGEIAKNIQKDLGITRKTIDRWLAGGMPEEIERLRRNSSTDHLKIPALPIGKVESIEAAELVGAFQAATRLADSRTTVHVSYSDAQTAARVKAMVESWQIAEEVKIINQRGDRRGQFGVVIYSRALFRSLMELTDSNNRLPWEMLGTEQEVCAYLRAFFSTVGTLHRGKFIFDSVRHPDLAVGVAVLLDQLGIPANIRTSPKISCRVNISYGVARMRALGLLAPRHLRSLEQFPLTGDTETDPGKKFLEALAFHRQNANAGAAEITRAVQAVYTTVVQWGQGDVPRVIRARQNVRTWAEKCGLPHRGVVAFLHRNFEVPVTECEKIGRFYNLDDVKAAIVKLREKSFDMRLLKIEDLKGVLAPSPTAAQLKKLETW